MSSQLKARRQLNGLQQIIDEFDVLVADQYGVLHNGQQAYPGVIDCLEMLKSRGKTLAVLSNSGRRAASNISRLQRLGYAPDLFDVVMTSGEMTWQALRNVELPFLGTAKRVFVIQGIGNRSILDELDYIQTEHAEDADFVLITGANQAQFDIEHYLSLLQPAMQSATPCICANPDVHALLNGDITYGPAAIAMRYASCGVEVHYFGKPHLPIYHKLKALLATTYPDCDSKRILCVGDSLAHDIKGANSANMSSALVLTGLQEFDGPSDHPDSQGINSTPDYVLPALIW